MWRRFLVAFAFAPALAGCGNDPLSATSVVPVSYAITANSAGPVTAATPYSAATLRQLFPNERIDVIATADEDGVVNAMTVFSDGLQVMMVIPDSGGRSIKSVHGSGLAVAGPNGERLGMTFKEAGASRDTCKVGTGPWLGMAVCTERSAPNVRLVFDNGGWDGPPNELAPMSNLAAGKLQRIVWVPERGA
jgi:hypothetical protein